MGRPRSTPEMNRARSKGIDGRAPVWAWKQEDAHRYWATILSDGELLAIVERPGWIYPSLWKEIIGHRTAARSWRYSWPLFRRDALPHGCGRGLQPWVRTSDQGCRV
jgi:hypothetical protein